MNKARRSALVEVGGWVRARADGGSGAAHKYAGQKGRLESIEPGLEANHLYYVLIGGNSSLLETAFEERDLLKNGEAYLGAEKSRRR